MNNRLLGSFSVPPVGLGCMNLSHAYGVPPSSDAANALLSRALDLGVTHFDTAALYGFGRNETLVGAFLKPFRDRIMLASKGGMRGENGVRTIDGRPEKLRQDVEHSLRRLDTDVIDLYYLHRLDLQTPVPVEESVGEMGRFVEEGKVRAIGLSEVSATTIRRAHQEYPLTAVQSEYSLWTRNPEIAVLETCRELGIALVAFSPLGRGFLTGVDVNPDDLAADDIRSSMPRFQEPDWSKNGGWLTQFRAIATEAGCTPAQLALAWVLSRGDHVHAIPGTTDLQHLEDNLGSTQVQLSEQILAQIAQLLDGQSISGARYPTSTQSEIDTEEF